MSNVVLAQLPEKRPTRILVGTTVRKSAAILRFYLNSLAAQVVPPGVELHPIFVDDNLDAASSKLLREFELHGRATLVTRAEASPANDFDDSHPETHQWSASAMTRVGRSKDFILDYARRQDFDGVWFVDADLICEPRTFANLLATPGPITTAVYWTRWSASGTETRKVHAAPQVWLRHPYDLSGAGYAEHEFRDRLARRQLTKVLGYGACTFIMKHALQAGVAFAPVPGVPMQGLMAGEDRHFCIRAQRLHLDGWACPWSDIFHIYHPSDLARAPEYAERLNAPRPERTERAYFGDLVNLTIQPIEPVPWAGGGWTAVPPQYVRGRLGAISLVPELEEAVYDMTRGETRTLPVHFPVSYPVPYYQGKRRLIRVTLNDVKPNRWAPVLEDELLVGTKSGAMLRTIDYTSRQLDGMREAANA